MNKLPLAKRVQILTMPVEGPSLRSVSRVAGCSTNTVTKLLVDTCKACASFHDEMIHYVRAKRVQRDEIWSFSYAKGNNLLQARAAPEGAGNVWTWTRVDADSKLIVTWYVGDRHQGAGARFMNDLRWRPANKVQLTTDGPKAYLTAIESRTSMPTTQCWLSTSSDKAGAGRYTPPICIGMTKHTLRGTPIRNTSARRMLSARTSPCACQ